MFIFLTSVNTTFNNDFDQLENLLLQTANGDKEAFSKLYGIAKSSVYGYALSILKNKVEAEDVMQSAFVNVFTNAEKYTPEGKPMAWILTLTKNLCLMKIRECEKTVFFEEGFEAYTPSTDDTAEIAQNKAIIAAALSLLSDDERQILMLHAVSGLKFREIAELSEKPIATVLSKYHRAIKKMKSAVGGEEK